MFLKSSELERIGDKNYLRIFLDEKYPYKIKYNGDDVEILDFVFEEPSMQDIDQLKKLSVSLEKLIKFQDNQVIKIVAQWGTDFLKEISEENQINARDEIEQNINSEEIKKDSIIVCREFIANLLRKTSDYEDETSNYFSEIEKFIKFIENKCYRNHGDSLVHKTNFSVLDNYDISDIIFLKEEIIIEYISFFFSRFPSKSLHANIKI